MRDGGVDQLVFFATHQLDGVDVRLLRALGNQLRSPRIHSWLLLKVDDGAATLGRPEQSTTDVGLDGAFSTRPARNSGKAVAVVSRRQPTDAPLKASLYGKVGTQGGFPMASNLDTSAATTSRAPARSSSGRNW